MLVTIPYNSPLTSSATARTAFAGMTPPLYRGGGTRRSWFSLLAIAHTACSSKGQQQKLHLSTTSVSQDCWFPNLFSENQNDLGREEISLAAKGPGDFLQFILQVKATFFS